MPKLIHTIIPKIHSWVPCFSNSNQKVKNNLNPNPNLTPNSLIHNRNKLHNYTESLPWMESPTSSFKPPSPLITQLWIHTKPATNLFQFILINQKPDLKLKYTIAKSLPLSILGLSLIDNFKPPLIHLPRAKFSFPLLSYFCSFSRSPKIQHKTNFSKYYTYLYFPSAQTHLYTAKRPIYPSINIPS